MCNIISHKVFVNSICKSQFFHKSVNLSLAINKLSHKGNLVTDSVLEATDPGEELAGKLILMCFSEAW